MAGRYIKQRENKYAKLRRKKIPKAQQGLMVPESQPVPSGMDGVSSVTTMSQTGSQMGKKLGPGGKIVGGIVGGVVGLATHGARKRQAKAENQRQGELADNYKRFGSSAVDPKLAMTGELAEHGLNKKNSGVIEIEAKKGIGELHYDKNYNLRNVGTKPHTKGGDKVRAEEGDVVFPVQGKPGEQKRIRGLVFKAKRGDKRAYAQLEQIREDLPQGSGGSEYAEGDGYVSPPEEDLIPEGDPEEGGAKKVRTASLKTLRDLVDKREAKVKARKAAKGEKDTLTRRERRIAKNLKEGDKEPGFLKKFKEGQEKKKEEKEEGAPGDFNRMSNAIQNTLDGGSGIEGYDTTGLSLERYKYNDMSAPRMKEAEKHNAIRRANRQGMVGSKGQQVTQAAQDEVMAQDARDRIIAEEIGRKDQIGNMNVDLANVENRHATQEAITGKNTERAQRAAARNLRRLGISEFADIADVDQQRDYMMSIDQKLDAKDNALFQMYKDNASNIFSTKADAYHNEDGSINQNAGILQTRAQIEAEKNKAATAKLNKGAVDSYKYLNNK